MRLKSIRKDSSKSHPLSTKEEQSSAILSQLRSYSLSHLCPWMICLWLSRLLLVWVCKAFRALKETLM